MDKIKVTRKQRKTNKDVVIEEIITVRPSASSYVRSRRGSQVKLSDFIERPVWHLRLYPHLKSYTNATDKEIEDILKLSKEEIKKWEIKNSKSKSKSTGKQSSLETPLAGNKPA